MSVPIIKTWNLKKRYLYVTGYVSDDIYLYVNWGNCRNSKVLVSGEFDVKIKVKGQAGKISLYLANEKSVAKGNKGCRPKECALGGEKICDCGEEIPCCNGLPPKADGTCVNFLPTISPLASLRVTPVCLTESIYERWKKEGPLVRISWVSEFCYQKSSSFSIDGILSNWQYTRRFNKEWGWGDVSVQSSIIPIGKGKLIIYRDNDKYSVDISYPSKSPHTLIIGDPQIDGRKTLENSQDVINKVINKYMDRLDLVILNGDNFYSCNDGEYNKIFQNNKIGDGYYSKPLIMTMGNHDYSLSGSAPSTGGKGKQYLLWYAVDAHESIWSNSSSIWNSVSETIPWGYTFGYYVFGDTAFITSDNSSEFNDNMKKLIPEIIAKFESLKVKYVYYVSHWHVKSDFAKQTTGQVFDILKPMFQGKKLELKTFFTGHTHENKIVESEAKYTGYLCGGNGRCEEEPCKNKCSNNPNCCPTYLDSNGNVHQGWGKDGPCFGI